MRRNRIAVRLSLYFGLSLLLFALIVGGVFAWSLGRYSVKLHRQELEDRATRIAGTVAEYLEGNPVSGQEESRGGMSRRGYGSDGGMGMQGGLSGFGRYLSFLDDIAMTDVWLVDQNYNLFTQGQGNHQIVYKDLPPDAEAVIAETFSGLTSFSESFSSVLGEGSLTVGVPITGEDGAVLGAVLLHSPIEGLEEIRTKQIQIMGISILVSLLITVPVVILFSLRFTNPLNRMKETSVKLTEGDYQAKNNIRQFDEIGELAGAMDTLADRLAENDRERGEMEQMRQAFFSNISHELRTPVTVMRASLEALCDGIVSEPEKIKEYHKQMLGESIHLQRLVNDLLELSRLQSVDFQMEMGDVNLRDIVEDVSRSMRRVAEQKQVQIKTDNLLGNIPLHGDYSRLRQMLMVVVDNAVKFSLEGGVVTLALNEANGLRGLSVIDQGSGIPAEELPYIFNRFHKERSEHNQQGSGLGLAIAKEIAARHGIKIVVSSHSGYTEFRFLLPQGITYSA